MPRPRRACRNLMIVLLGSVASLWACGPGIDEGVDQASPRGEPAGEETLVERARRFRSLLSEGKYDAARGMMALDARRWFRSRENEGQPWTLGATTGGPWARWDEYFGSTGEVVEWTEGERWASAIVRETNDYYRLLERGPQRNWLTYHFDESGLIEGLVIGSAGERDMGLTEQFRAWAQDNRPEEIAELMPEGEIDPSHPERFRRLLEEWRQATDREPIE